MIALLCISVAANIFLLMPFLSNLRGPKPETEKQISELVRQVCSSLESDSGWKYIPATKEKADAWVNTQLDLFLTISATVQDGPMIYRWQKKADSAQNIQGLSLDEVQLVRTTIAERELRQFLSKRIDCVSSQLDEDISLKFAEESARARA